MASIFDKEPERKVEKLKYLIGKLNIAWISSDYFESLLLPQ